MKVSAIILAAGKGLRLGADISKSLVLVNSKPLISYSLEAFNCNSLIGDIVIVANKENWEAISILLNRFHIKKPFQLVKGGLLRQDSVRNGLEATGEQSKLVVVHDGARPFVSQEIISAVIKEAKHSGAAIAGVPVKATVKEVNSKYSVIRTLKRNKLWEIQTPQAFRKELLLEAYKRFGKSEVTDDAGLVEKTGAKVSVVLGSYRNIKITTPEDLVIAQAFSSL